MVNLKWEKTKFLVSKLPPKLSIGVYSMGRQVFLSGMKRESPKEAYVPPSILNRRLWGIDFRTPLFNAAGVFKDFSCYDLAFKQGAGAYLVGTITPTSNEGNQINGIHLPFAIYPNSHASSNSLGLPNKGIVKTLEGISEIERFPGFPIGISLTSDSLEELVYSLQLCEEKRIDFVELNESCPNKKNAGNLRHRLEYVKKKLLEKVDFPVIVKLSNDLDFAKIPDVMDLLFELGYDGINFGNSSVDYSGMRNKIHLKDLPLYDFFTKNFKGGLSGEPLKHISLELSSIAVQYVKAASPQQEFHVIRTGGIQNSGDIQASEKAGVSLNQTGVGYFENFITHGDNLYKNILEKKDG
jgi:dihydroorotate dehydrogenase